MGSTNDTRPNVLLITVDTLRADRIGACGDTITRTPIIDNLASQGVASCRLIAAQPGTNAAHASIFTGASPNVHGIQTHMVDHLAAGVTTLAETLGKAGYQTAGIYSWVSFEPAFSGLNRGFDSYEGYVGHAPSVLENPLTQNLAALYRRLKDRLAVIRTSEELLGLASRLEESVDRRADVTTDAALSWLDRRSTRPFFLWVHYFDPHYPYTPPEPFGRLYDPDYDGTFEGNIRTVWGIESGAVPITYGSRDNDHLVALYRGEISYIDDQIGRLLLGLKASGLLENALIVLTGDHGESFGEHGAWFHPTSPYNAEIQVPFVVRFPVGNRIGRIDGPISATDVMPTILDFLHLPVPSTVTGLSLLPQAYGLSRPSSRVVFSQFDQQVLLAAIGSDRKLIVNQVTGDPELVDLLIDPLEQVNTAGLDGEELGRLSEELRAWMQREGVREKRPLNIP